MQQQEYTERMRGYEAQVCCTSCGKLLQSPAFLASQYPPLYLKQ